MLGSLNIDLDGNKYSTNDAVPYGLDHVSGSNDMRFMEFKVDLFDEDGNIKVAEFHIPHSQVIMNCNLFEYTEFMAKRLIPKDLVNTSNLYDIL